MDNWTRIGEWRLPRRTAIVVLLAVSTGLPIVLVVHAVEAARELRQMRSIFLRERAAAVAARVEASPADLAGILRGDPAVLDVRLFRVADPAGEEEAVAAIRNGLELFRTETRGEVFRAWAPVHVGDETAVAQIELSAGAPDFLLAHARHNVALTAASSGALLALAGFALWSMQRAARFEKRQMETERLAELGALSAVLAHEIRNPLGAIKGFAQLARETAGTAAAARLDSIVRESARLEKLVHSLLLYGRPQQPSMRTTAWQAIAADVEAHAREAIGARPIAFETAGDAPDLYTDPDLLKQALLNLVRNAIEAIPEDARGRVRLWAEVRRDGGAVIAVEDDGPGLPGSVRARMFAPFVTAKASGTGLGLPISRKIVEALGGALRLSDVEPHGTKAEVILHGTNSHR